MCCFWLFQTNVAYWTVAPKYPAQSQKACSIIINPNLVDWYKLVNVSWFDWDVEELKSFWCIKWYIFLVPEDLDVSNIKTIEWPEDKIDEYPGYYYAFFDPSLKSFSFWTNFKRTLENEDSKLVWKLSDYSIYYSQEKSRPSHVLNFYVLKLQKNWEYWLNYYDSISYEYYYILYIIWWIILVCWVVYYIKRKKRNTWDKVE